MNIKSHHCLLYFFITFVASTTYAEESIFENNIEVLEKDAVLNSSISEKRITKSAFYPEFNIVTGVGSEYTKDKSETEKGGILYLDSKINLYSGKKDYINLNIDDSKIIQAKLNKTLEIRKIQIKAYKIIQDLKSLSEENDLLETEKENNNKQSAWAKKKVDAGLTTNVELLDFQIKKTNLENEIAVNNLKIKENETELLNLFGNKYSLEQISKQVNQAESPFHTENINIQALNEKILIEDLNISEFELQKSKSNNYPKLDLEAKSGNITPTSKILSDKTEHQVALTLKIPFFSGFSTQSEIQKSANEKMLKEKILRNYQSINESNFAIERKKIELSKSLLKSQEGNLSKSLKFHEQTMVEYKRGLKNSSDLISSSDRVLEINRKIIELKKEIKLASYNLHLNYFTEEDS